MKIVAWSITGNVGIGTTAPTASLEVQNGNVNSTEIIAKGDYSNIVDPAQFLITGYTNPNQQLQLGYHTTNDYGSIQAIKQGTSAKPLVLQPYGGNVGIGITSPGALLDVAGVSRNIQTATSMLSGTNNSPGIYQYMDSSAIGHIDALANNAYTTGLQLRTYNSGTYNTGVMINNVGNVGIGTTNPSKPLEVAGTIKSTSGGFAFPDGTTQTTAATSGGITFSGSTSAMDVTVPISVASNSLLSTNPTTSVITAPYSGNYLLTGLTGVCSGSFGGTYAVSMKVNGAWVAYAQNSTNCETTSFSVFFVISAGDTISGVCGNNIGYTTNCTWSIVKL